MSGAAIKRALLAVALLATGLGFPILLASWSGIQDRFLPDSADCRPDIVVAKIAGQRALLPFDTRLSLAPNHRRYQLHTLRTTSGQSAYCRASRDGASAYNASQAYLFAKSARADALCPQPAGSPFSGVCSTQAPVIQRIALAIRDGDALQMTTTGEDFAQTRARDPWKSDTSVTEVGGRVTRYADEYRRIDRPQGPIYARCWPVGPQLQCDASEMLGDSLRVEWTVIGSYAEIGAVLVGAEARIRGILQAAGLR